MENNREVRPWDFFKKDTKYASVEVAKERMNICKSCEHFFKLTQQCKICLCLMQAKTILADAECPKRKWLKTTKYKTNDEDYIEE